MTLRIGNFGAAGPLVVAALVIVAGFAAVRVLATLGAKHDGDSEDTVWDPVDEASMESFPASDPPAYSPPRRKKPTGR